jgi:hypothetical protein
VFIFTKIWLVEMPKRNDLEQKVIQIIMRVGFEGALQSELWRQLGANSREISRIALKLERIGLIRRERELSNGKWTYRLFPKRVPASIESIGNCPCLLCQESSKCDPSSQISPQKCKKLTEWIFSISEKEN